MKSKLKIVILLMFVLGIVFLIFGHITIRNEQIDMKAVQGEYLGVARAVADDDTVTFTFEENGEKTSLTVAKEIVHNAEGLTADMPVFVLADLQRHAVHEEKRSIILGRLKGEKDEEFYRIISINWRELSTDSTAPTPTIAHSLIDYTGEK